MNNFDKYEKLGENKVLPLLLRLFAGFEVVHTKSGCHWDYEIIKNGKVVGIVESKDRNCRIDQYDTAILTDDKYENLLKESKSKGITAYFISTYIDGHYAIWNLTDGSCTPSESTTWAPRYTAVNSGSKIKKAWNFKFSEAKIIY